MKLQQFFWGFFLILTGLLFLADQFIEGINAGEIFSIFWPLIFVFVGLSAILSKPRKIITGTIFLFLGTILITSNFVDFDVWRLWPLILIVIGLSIIFGREKKVDINNNTQHSKDSQVSSNVVFWGSEIRNSSKEFKGGDLTAVFGGIELDLRDATIAEDGATINIDAVFAGIEVRVPRDAEVVVKGTGIFGAFENRARTPENAKGGVLTITGSATFAGVEISN